MYAGANGAGKSTLRAGSADSVEVDIDPDRIAREMKPSGPRSIDLAAGKEALRRFDQAITEGRSLSLETTLTGRTVLTRMHMAKTAGYRVELLYVGLRDADLHIERVQTRVVKGGHWIDPEVVRRRVIRSLENLPAAIGLANRTMLLDNTEVVHRPVLEIEHGRVLFVAADLPPWLADHMAGIMEDLNRLDS